MNVDWLGKKANEDSQLDLNVNLENKRFGGKENDLLDVTTWRACVCVCINTISFVDKIMLAG